jgi:predicted kinase
VSFTQEQKDALADYLAPLLSAHIAPGKSWESVLRGVAEELSGRPEWIAKVVQKHVYKELYKIAPRGDA